MQPSRITCPVVLKRLGLASIINLSATEERGATVKAGQAAATEAIGLRSARLKDFALDYVK